MWYNYYISYTKPCKIWYTKLLMWFDGFIIYNAIECLDGRNDGILRILHERIESQDITCVELLDL